jgi:hypothetical protein
VQERGQVLGEYMTKEVSEDHVKRGGVTEKSSIPPISSITLNTPPTPCPTQTTKINQPPHTHPEKSNCMQCLPKQWRTPDIQSFTLNTGCKNLRSIIYGKRL